MDSRIDARKKDFKKSFEDPRRVREDEQVQISRANRDARLTKKRMTPAAPSGGIQGTTTSTASSLTPVPDVNELPGLVAALNSPDDAVVEGTAEKVSVHEIRKYGMRRFGECSLCKRIHLSTR